MWQFLIDWAPIVPYLILINLFTVVMLLTQINRNLEAFYLDIDRELARQEVEREPITRR